MSADRQPLGLSLPPQDRELIKDIFFSDAKIADQIRHADPKEPMIPLTLDDLDLLAGDIRPR